MAMNKYMHPRNLYKTPPDFSKLAKLFAEFSSIAKTDVTGKVTIDFKDPHCLRVLTKCLLKSDFGLDVVIPEDRLVPTLPLRLNYILWIEDLLYSIDRKVNIKGLDIGTGACAIYPLLAAAKNKWHMIGTESDQESLLKAQENIIRNNLRDLVEVRKNSTSTILEFLFTEDNSQTYHFCMCNPPFYSNVQELYESRSPARMPPKNGFTGSPQELITDGGELTFCRKIIKESKVYKDKVLIFSTMVGHKYNLKELAQDLRADSVNYTTTEFCQGRVTRWGLAWTYQDFDINNFVPCRDKQHKKSVPIVYVLPELDNSPYNFQTISTKLLEMLNVLKINYKILDKIWNQMSLEVIASNNTWSNQRRKRRLMKMQQGDSKKLKLDEDSNVVAEAFESSGLSHGNNQRNVTNDDGPQTKLDEPNIVHNVNNNEETSSNILMRNEDRTINKSDGKVVQPYQKAVESICKMARSTAALDNSKDFNVPECLITSEDAEPLVRAIFKILKKGNDIVLEMEFLNGTGGKESVHQIMQYIKNNWR